MARVAAQWLIHLDAKSKHSILNICSNRFGDQDRQTDREGVEGPHVDEQKQRLE